MRPVRSYISLVFYSMMRMEEIWSSCVIDCRMVNVKKGVMITCDPAMKQLLMHLDESRALGSKFIVKELDETHLFVDKEIEEVLEKKLDDLMEAMNPENTDK